MILRYSTYRNSFEFNSTRQMPSSGPLESREAARARPRSGARLSTISKARSICAPRSSPGLGSIRRGQMLRLLVHQMPFISDSACSGVVVEAAALARLAEDGRVECRHHRQRQRPALEDVDRAPPARPPPSRSAPTSSRRFGRSGRNRPDRRAAAERRSARPSPGFSRPLTNRMLSRIASASRRRRLKRESSRFSGSLSFSMQTGFSDAWRYVFDSSISLCIALMLPARLDEA